MGRPWGLSLDRTTKRGRVLLRAGNVVDSVGRGPIELHGVRYNRVYMHARQRIYKRGRGFLMVRTGARLRLKLAHLGLRWWKFFNAARFELWTVDAQGRRAELVRTGPKVSYCLRDLTHTRPMLRRTPLLPVYPACNTNPRQRRVRLGTSVGWADIYPPSYPEQWIDVTGLRGCFAYVHTADPLNGVYESNEDNNEAQVIVRLPFKLGHARRGCRGRDRGRPHDPRQYPG
jgi:Lysyl oxidase